MRRGPVEGGGGKPPLELGLELKSKFLKALHPGRMRWIVDAARDRRILLTWHIRVQGGTMEMAGAGKKLAKADPQGRYL